MSWEKRYLNEPISYYYHNIIYSERGHVLQRKFITDPISRRHTSKLIETEKNEYFTLDGELSDTKRGNTS